MTGRDWWYGTRLVGLRSPHLSFLSSVSGPRGKPEDQRSQMLQLLLQGMWSLWSLSYQRTLMAVRTRKQEPDMLVSVVCTKVSASVNLNNPKTQYMFLCSYVIYYARHQIQVLVESLRAVTSPHYPPLKHWPTAPKRWLQIWQSGARFRCAKRANNEPSKLAVQCAAI